MSIHLDYAGEVPNRLKGKLQAFASLMIVLNRTNVRMLNAVPDCPQLRGTTNAHVCVNQN